MISDSKQANRKNSQTRRTRDSISVQILIILDIIQYHENTEKINVRKFNSQKARKEKNLKIIWTQKKSQNMSYKQILI